MKVGDDGYLEIEIRGHCGGSSHTGRREAAAMGSMPNP